MPPSMQIFSPLIKPALSEHKNRIIFEISSGLPTLPANSLHKRQSIIDQIIHMSVLINYILCKCFQDILLADISDVVITFSNIDHLIYQFLLLVVFSIVYSCFKVISDNTQINLAEWSALIFKRYCPI